MRMVRVWLQWIDAGREAQAAQPGALFSSRPCAGPRRFELPISVGELMVDGALVSARLVGLAVDSPA
jgi:hypothetical protein